MARHTVLTSRRSTTYLRSAAKRLWQTGVTLVTYVLTTEDGKTLTTEDGKKLKL